jgi:hypothetical protein
VRLRLAILLLLAGAGLSGCDGDDSSSSGSRTAKTVRPVSDSKRAAEVWAVGDAADGGAHARRVADMIARAKPDRVLYLGDVYVNGTEEEYARNYRPVFGRFDAITAPTPGNHEWHTRAEGYDPYWKAAGLVTDRHYYSFKTAGWEIVSLNSESGLEDGSPQRRWLPGALAERGNCRVVFWHRPYLNAGRHGDQKETAPLWRAVRGHAVLVLNGHDHNFQHFKRRAGIVQLISGAGGHGLYESDERDPRLVWDEDDEYGAVRLDLRPGVARFRFVAAPGRTLHKGSVRCRTS